MNSSKKSDFTPITLTVLLLLFIFSTPTVLAEAPPQVIVGYGGNFQVQLTDIFGYFLCGSNCVPPVNITPTPSQPADDLGLIFKQQREYNKVTCNIDVDPKTVRINSDTLEAKVTIKNKERALDYEPTVKFINDGGDAVSSVVNTNERSFSIQPGKTDELVIKYDYSIPKVEGYGRIQLEDAECRSEYIDLVVVTDIKALPPEIPLTGLVVLDNLNSALTAQGTCDVKINLYYVWALILILAILYFIFVTNLELSDNRMVNWTGRVVLWLLATGVTFIIFDYVINKLIC